MLATPFIGSSKWKTKIKVTKSCCTTKPSPMYSLQCMVSVPKAWVRAPVTLGGMVLCAHEFLTAAREGTGSATARGIWLANRVYLLWTVASFFMCDCLR